jgi:hypothetical protein
MKYEDFDRRTTKQKRISRFVESYKRKLRKREKTYNETSLHYITARNRHHKVLNRT